jgi:putative flavoprotein involved in K+ transport
VPQLANGAPSFVEQVVPRDYRSPEQLPPGGVLIVGASATGIQLADELRRTGREVVLAAGQHTRLPRTYRGHDILWWLDRLGILQQDATCVYDLEVSRAQSSLQLVGRADRATLDLAVLRALGVRITGRLLGFTAARATFDDDLIATTAASDLKLAGVLQRVDAFIAQRQGDAPPAPPFDPLWPQFVDNETTIDLRSAGIRTIIWATGYRRAYPWMRVPVLDARGEIVHSGGVTPVPGLYVIGLQFLRRRNSSFIDGVGADARDLSHHLARHVGAACPA